MKWLADNSAEAPPPLESEHFRLHYRWRNPARGLGHGTDGVPDKQLLLAYQEGLERLYRTLTAPPWSRPALPDKIQVEVFDLAAYLRSDERGLTAERDGVPFIWLPSRTNLPTRAGELQFAQALAVHEATHVFNCRERPLNGLYEGNWAWFDEAFAVYMEMRLLGDAGDHLRFSGAWIAHPQQSLDSPTAWYQASRFVAYLVNRCGEAAVVAPQTTVESSPLFD